MNDSHPNLGAPDPTKKELRTTSPEPATDPPDPRRWKALGALALVQFMLVLDITVVNVALPHIKVDLGFSPSGLSWVVDAYTLTAGGFLLLGGRLADLLGRRRLFISGLVLFALSSVLSGAAWSPGILVAGRFAQGVGEAMTTPAAFGLIALLFTDTKERAKALGIAGGVAGLGGTLGPVISGFIVEFLDWRWIFFVNIPVAVFTVIAVNRLVSESRAETTRGGRPDVEGAALATAGLVGIVYGLVKAASSSWGSAEVLVPLVAGVLLLVGFVLRERSASNPLIPLRFFDNRTRVTSNLVAVLFSGVFFTQFFFLTLYLQDVLHFSSIRTGVSYLPFGVFISLGIGVSTKLIPKMGTKVVFGTGFLFAGAGALCMGFIGAHGGYLDAILPGEVLAGFGSGMCFAGFGNASVHGVSAEDASLASGVQSATQQVGGALGLSLLVTVALRHEVGRLAHGATAAVAQTSGTVLVYRISALIMLAGAVGIALFVEKGNSSEPVDAGRGTLPGDEGLSEAVSGI